MRKNISEKKILYIINVHAYLFLDQFFSRTFFFCFISFLIFNFFNFPCNLFCPSPKTYYLRRQENLKSMTTMRNRLHTASILLGTHAEELPLLCPNKFGGGYKSYSHCSLINTHRTNIHRTGNTSPASSCPVFIIICLKTHTSYDRTLV